MSKSFVTLVLAYIAYRAYVSDTETALKIAREATRLAELQVIAAGHALPPREGEPAPEVEPGATS